MLFIFTCGGIAQWYSSDRGFESRQGLGIFLFTTVSRPALTPTKHPIRWSTRGCFTGGKADGAWSWPPPSAEVKNVWSYTSTPKIRLHGVVLSLKKSTGTTLHLPYYNYCMLQKGKW